MSRGLLGLVVVLCLLGGAAGLALSGLPGSGSPKPALGVTGPGTRGSAPHAVKGGAAPASSPDRGALAASCRADAQSVDAAVQAYTAQNGTYPTSLQQLVPTWLPALPSTAHYLIVVDRSGHVGVFATGTRLTGTVPDSANYDLHPELCDSVPR